MGLRIAVLETSTNSSAVAVADEDRILGVRRLTAARRHARDLIPLLREATTEQGWTPADLDLVVVDRGPGSFTGLRVAVMAAKTLAFALGTRVVAVEALEALAANAPSPFPSIVPVVDGQQGSVYSARFESAGEKGAVRRTPTDMTPAADWLASLRPGDYVVGPTVDRWAPRLPPGCVAAEEEKRTPDVAVVWRLGMRAFRAGELADPESLQPLYLRPSSAEQKWKQREQAAPRP